MLCEGLQWPDATFGAGSNPEGEHPMRTVHAALLAATLALVSPIASAEDVDPYGFNRQGFIRNAVGGQCWYVQIFEKTNPHFTPSKSYLKNQNLRTIRFNDSECMADAVASDRPLGVMSLMRSLEGHLTNLSTAPPASR